MMLVTTRDVMASTTPFLALIIAFAATLRLSASSCASNRRVNSGAVVVPVAFVSLSVASLSSLSTASGVMALLDLDRKRFV